jgi:hypothetical protein
MGVEAIKSSRESSIGDDNEVGLGAAGPKAKIMGEDHELLDPDNLASVELDPAETRRLLRKLDWHIAPVCMILYLIAFLDRANIGMCHLWLDLFVRCVCVCVCG